MNVFIITSPFQYICANEARESYQAKDNLLVIIEQNSQIGKKQMSALVDESDWDYILRFDRKKRTTNTPKIIKKVLELSKGNLDTFFYSEYRSWRNKLLIRNLDFKKHIFFDDGTMMFVDYYDHLEPKKAYYRPRLIQDFQLKLQGIKPIGRLPFFENTEIFSVFDLPGCVTKFRSNNLKTLSDKFSQVESENTHYDIFIGQGRVDEKSHNISLSEYLVLLEEAQQCSDSPLLYIPHRTEMAHVTEAIKRLDNLIYHMPSFPIEIELYKEKVQPVNIIGLSSTALYTLSKLYPSCPVKVLVQKGSASIQKINRIQNYLNDHFANKS
ncbi:hypothetical protein BCU68_09285 [Vibrio sp. 10N.286.49.B3]|uniref:glycosyltransferase 52 family protein n=1 Tax=Vibrio sp. 10N.286.49.B3 TaxID=1880855 RepID=UPI000C8646A0|nr:glycosyltransferase 52 family protein [Vibrio sp. 10N.286.49.B3]PMH45977.1 hypothetical protein BCU68_09285 [Vibrio sp. 10N.286.49.B3]